MLLLSQITINHQSIIRAAGSKSVLICANLWSIKTAADIPRCRVFTLCKTARRKKLHSNHQIISIYPSLNNKPHISSFIPRNSSNGQLG